MNFRSNSRKEPAGLRGDEGNDESPLAALHKVRHQLAAASLAVANALEARPAISFLLLMAVFVPAALGHSLNKALWHDELFTFYISQEPSLHKLFLANRLVDLIPPLSFLLTRGSFHLFGINTLSARLPEMAGFLLAMFSLFAFVRRRAGTLYGLLAATLLYTGAAGELLAEARPYGLMLGFGCLSFLAWQKARDNDRSAVALLLISGFGMLLTHVFSVFLWGALAAAEAIRIVQRRRIEWPLVLAWTLPLISVLTYLPLLRTHGGGIFPAAFQPTGETIFIFYMSRIEREITSLLLAAVFMLLIVGRRGLRGGSSWFLSVPEWAATIFVMLMPLMLIALLMRSHAAFFLRYGTSASIGISILSAILLARWTAHDTRAALACILIALLITGELHFTVGAVLHRHLLTSTEPSNEPCQACALTLQLDPTLPLVDASGLTFLEMDNREDSATLRRLFYLTDPEASREYAHANIFEAMALEKSLFPIRANVDTYADFIQHHPHFFVLGDYAYPEDWLLRKLQADGATLRMLGTTRNSYKDHDLYEVSF